MKNGLQNGAKIDAKIIQCRFWAAKGRQMSILNAFWAGLEEYEKTNDETDEDEDIDMEGGQNVQCAQQ